MEIKITIEPLNDVDIEIKPVSEQVASLNDMVAQIQKGFVGGIILMAPTGRGPMLEYRWKLKTKLP